MKTERERERNGWRLQGVQRNGQVEVCGNDVVLCW